MSFLSKPWKWFRHSQLPSMLGKAAGGLIGARFGNPMIGAELGGALGGGLQQYGNTGQVPKQIGQFGQAAQQAGQDLYGQGANIMNQAQGTGSPYANMFGRMAGDAFGGDRGANIGGQLGNVADKMYSAYKGKGDLFSQLGGAAQQAGQGLAQQGYGIAAPDQYAQSQYNPVNQKSALSGKRMNGAIKRKLQIQNSGAGFGY